MKGTEQTPMFIKTFHLFFVLMTSKQRTYRTPYYVQKINFDNNNRKIRKRPPKPCPGCKETSNCVKLIAGKVNKIEETIENFYKNHSKKGIGKFSIYSAKFTLNNVPCELEYDLTKFSMEIYEISYFYNSKLQRY
jgi:hypothetical protein